MKKIAFSIVACLILSLFNFYPEASAQTYYEWKNQDVTAYVGSMAGHGANYGFYNSRFDTVAVHKNGSNIPYIPFGTVVQLSSSISLPYEGGTRYKSIFTVTDTGTGSGRTSHWLDIYYGAKSTTNEKWAKEFGNNKGKKISYTAWY